ncbi:MAG TPA: hypothetical protein VFH58_03070, partial [Acidimicrobiales bacterium]|nr:hypothetical protein [Acidimicrobiales bacterium]
MEPARVALDIQALQEGSGVAPDRCGRIAARAGALAGAGRLAAALMAPELPPPDPALLPPELKGSGAALLRWDCRREMRALLASNPRLVHHVPVPLLHSEPGDPGGLIVSFWSEAPVARVVTLDASDVERLLDPAPRLQVRLEWIRQSDAVEAGPGADLERIGLGGQDGVGGAPRVLGAGEGLDDLYETAARAVAGSSGDAGDAGDARDAGDLPLHVAVYGPFPPGGGGIGAYNARFVTALNGSGVRVDAITVTGMGWEPPDGVLLVQNESFGTDVRPASYDAVVYTIGNSDGHLATVEAALRYPGWLWLHEARLPAIATTALAALDDASFQARMERLLHAAYPGRPPLPAARAAGRSHLALAGAGVG